MKVPVYSRDGKKKEEMVLRPEIYGARVNDRLLALIRRAYAANLRHGTASTKTRKEVRGGGRKPWRQKGTGRARHSSIRSPIWRGGGTVFGPHPRSYFVALPKAMKKKALISALSLRARDKNLAVLENMKMETPKTKEFVEIIKAMPLGNKRALCVVREMTETLKRATRNVSGLASVRAVKDLNAYHILEREKLLIEQAAVPAIEARILGSAAADAGADEKGQTE